MNARAALAALLLASVMTACGGGSTNPPLLGSAPGASPTPPRLGAVLGHANYTTYMFHNYSASNGLPTSPPNDGALPKGTLTAVQSGSGITLYGRTPAGGNNIGHDGIGCGTFFSTNTSFGSSYNVVYAFSGSDGCDPRHDAMVLINGTLYSTTQGVNDTSKDTYNNGDAHALVPGGTPSIVLAYAGAPNQGAQQHSSFTLDQTFGNVLFGQTAKGGANDKGQVYAITPSGSSYYPIHDFSKSEGTEPHGRIIQLGPTLWGITRSDGAGGGTVFSLVLTYSNGIPQPQPTINIIHSFVSGGSDAYFSDHGYLTPVTEGGQTVLYGMTQCGGGGTGGDSHHCGSGMGDGAIFRVVPHMTNGQYDGTGSYSVYYAFQGQDTALPNGEHDGADPYGSLYYDAGSGYMYGMTAYGGSSDDDGTVFRFIPGTLSTYQVIYHFTGKNGDGAKPIDNVIISGGTIYGMTVYGGTSDDSLDGTKGGGNGTIFAIPVP